MNLLTSRTGKICIFCEVHAIKRLLKLGVWHCNLYFDVLILMLDSIIFSSCGWGIVSRSLFKSLDRVLTVFFSFWDGDNCDNRLEIFLFSHLTRWLCANTITQREAMHYLFVALLCLREKWQIMIKYWKKPKIRN